MGDFGGYLCTVGKAVALCGDCCAALNLLGCRSTDCFISRIEKAGHRPRESRSMVPSAARALRKGVYDQDRLLLKLDTRTTQVLELGGFKIEHMSVTPRIMRLPGSFIDFLRTLVRGQALGMLSDEEAEIAMQEISDLCEPDLMDETGRWAVIYTSLRFVAVVPA